MPDVWDIKMTAEQAADHEHWVIQGELWIKSGADSYQEFLKQEEKKAVTQRTDRVTQHPGSEEENARSCGQCGDPLPSSHPHAKFCSQSCKQKAYRSRNSA